MEGGADDSGANDILLGHIIYRMYKGKIPITMLDQYFTLTNLVMEFVQTAGITDENINDILIKLNGTEFHNDR